MRRRKAPTTLFLFISLFILADCSRGRDPASDSTMILPDATISNTPVAPGDEPPIVKTTSGFEVSSIPGVPPIPHGPLQYVTYYGPSN